MATQDEMNSAAEVAIKELKAIKPDAPAQDLVDWFRKHYRQAGYKRLCRPLLGASQFKTG